MDLGRGFFRVWVVFALLWWVGLAIGWYADGHDAPGTTALLWWLLPPLGVYALVWGIWWMLSGFRARD
ncbi:hypothetical protein EOD42_09440 [Rhodovarius crocodyli]|uniref:DUF997 family protein n=1 Tax=Rhodovarius crocodyli TaxID=1979269 RepID=A0A437MG46_9PROT|nr:hypothetical protein [Rhodovarius crocodyli]RVT96633.1 hypothetical protein EOD42_09440 [Rhodovarius crocodyli]